MEVTMPGTKAGGVHIRKTNLAKDPDFYKKLGARGGLAKKTKPSGFATMSPERIRELAAKGGANSRRGKQRKAKKGN